MTARYAFSFASSHGSTRYETIVREDWSVSCDCPGWIFARGPNPRTCKHAKAVLACIEELKRGVVPRELWAASLGPLKLWRPAPLANPKPEPGLLDRGFSLEDDDE